MSVFTRLYRMFRHGEGSPPGGAVQGAPAALPGALRGDAPGASADGADALEFTRVQTGMLRAIIHAVRAHDETLLGQALGSIALPGGAWRLVEPILAEDVSPERVAGSVADGDEALILYILSRFVVRGSQAVNHGYFERLAAALRISPSEKIMVERQIGRMERRDFSVN